MDHSQLSALDVTITHHETLLQEPVSVRKTQLAILCGRVMTVLPSLTVTQSAIKMLTLTPARVMGQAVDFVVAVLRMLTETCRVSVSVTKDGTAPTVPSSTASAIHAAMTVLDPPQWTVLA